MYRTCRDWKSFKQVLAAWFINSASIANFSNQRVKDSRIVFQTPEYDKFGMLIGVHKPGCVRKWLFCVMDRDARPAVLLDVLCNQIVRRWQTDAPGILSRRTPRFTDVAAGKTHHQEAADPRLRCNRLFVRILGFGRKLSSVPGSLRIAFLCVMLTQYGFNAR